MNDPRVDAFVHSLDPVPREDDLPVGAADAAALLARIDGREAMDSPRLQEDLTPTRPSLGRWWVAAAALVAVLVVGVAIGLTSGGRDDGRDVGTPLATTTSQAATTTSQAATTTSQAATTTSQAATTTEAVTTTTAATTTTVAQVEQAHAVALMDAMLGFEPAALDRFSWGGVAVRNEAEGIQAFIRATGYRAAGPIDCVVDTFDATCSVPAADDLTDLLGFAPVDEWHFTFGIDRETVRLVRWQTDQPQEWNDFTAWLQSNPADPATDPCRQDFWTEECGRFFYAQAERYVASDEYKARSGG